LAAAARDQVGELMETKEFLSKLEHDGIVEAIRAAESKTSAEIRIYVHRGELKEDAVISAQKEFVRLGMDKTRDRNGVLIFLVPRAQEFAVIGDEEVHKRCGDQLWQQLVDKMSEHFGKERFSEAIVEAIAYLGGVLAQHFPKKWTNPNELSDEIIET
jgi:uncharacterized membrane protein